jgi:hypothetical protein
MSAGTDPTFLPEPGRGDRGPARAAGLRGRLRPRRPGQGRHDGAGLRPGLTRLRPGGRLVGAAHRRQRAPPLRLERLLVRPLPPRPPRPRPTPGTPLSGRPRHPVLPELCAGHQTRPPPPQAGPRDHRRGAGRQGRLLTAPHRPLRPRRHLPLLAGRANGDDGPGGVALLDHDSFEVIGPGSWTGASSTSPTTAGGTSTTTP